MEVLLLYHRWFLLVQKSTTLEITSWSAASKLPWWGWRRSRQTLMMKTEETRRRGVWTGRTEKRWTDRRSCWIDEFSTVLALKLMLLLEFFWKPWTLTRRAPCVASDFSVMLSDAFSFSESGQGVGTIVQIHFICRNSHCASITLKSRPV